MKKQKKKLSVLKLAYDTKMASIQARYQPMAFVVQQQISKLFEEQQRLVKQRETLLAAGAPKK